MQIFLCAKDTLCPCTVLFALPKYPMFVVFVGSVEVQIANMSKTDRSKTDEVYVCGFVPSYTLPKKMPWSLDPFLHLLISDIEDAFIDCMWK